MKKLFTFLIALIASVGTASAQSGTCGDNLTWELNTETGILTISGTGAMADYAYNTMPWYDYRSSIKSVIITDGVTSIGQYAFYRCSKLTSVTIPNSVTSIGDNAFYNCSPLTSITIPNSVTSIGDDAFFACFSLASINVDSNNPNYSSVDGVLFNKDKTTLIQYPIDNTRSEYTIPNSVTSIGYRAFNDCSSLTSVTIPNSVTSIGDRAFVECTKLSSVTIPNSVTSIGEYAFAYCSSLTSINVDSNHPNYSSVDGVLFNKDKTTLVAYPGGKQGAYTIPNSVTSIGSYAFRGCSSLTSVTIPNSVTSIGHDAFNDCSSLTSVTIPNSVISTGCFSYCSSLTSVTIPNSVTSIGGLAFLGCSSLTSVAIPNSVTSIGILAFLYCDSLTSVTFEGRTPPSIERDVFDNTNNCPIYVPCGTKDAYVAALNKNNTIDESRVIEKSPYIYSIASSDNTLGSVTITQEPTTCTAPLIFRADAAEGYQFAQWSDGNTDNPRSLILTQDTTLKAEFELAQCLIASGYCGADSTNLTWELSCDGVLTISGTGAMADYAYNTMPWYDYRSSIKSVIITDGVTSIGMFAFDNCNSLTSVTIPNSVISIGGRAFSGCFSLKSITIPNSVTSIGDVAFADCSSLTSITIPNSVTSIGNHAFYGCSSLTSVTIPNGVTSIGVFAFSGCSSLTSVTIPNSVTSIGNYAFSGCKSLTSVTIPNSVTSIGDNAFSGCFSLTSINVDSNNPNYSSVDGVLFNKDKTTLVACPGGKQGAYTIPNSVTSIGEDAFLECSSLTSITIPNSVTSIGYEAFYSCTGLTSVTFEGPNPPSFRNFSFYDTNNCLFYVPCGTKDAYVAALIERDIDESRVIEKTFIASGYCGAQGDNLTWELSCDSVLTISGTGAMADYTFASKTPWYEYRSSIQSVIITDGVTSIGEMAFFKCSSLTSITIPNSVTSIEYGAFYECSSLTSVTFESITPPIIKKAFNNTNNCPIYVPCGTKDAYVAALNENNTIDESRVIEKIIASGYCGADSTNLTWELSCDSVLTISGTGAMADYTYNSYAPWYEYRSSIQSVIITDGVTSIGNQAFWGCYSLTSVTIPNSVTSIGNYTFQGCSSLTSIDVDTNNPNYCSVDGVLFNKDITKLIQYSIGNIRSEYAIPNSVASIGDGAFYGCSSLTSITIPNSVTSIESSAFHYCFSLTFITIPNSVTSIGNYTFYDCSSLTSVTIGNSVTSIGSKAFEACSSLKSMIVESGNTVYDSRENCNAIIETATNTLIVGCQNTIIPNSVTSIENGAFSGCSSLTSMTIPNSVTSIENGAFSGCSSLTSVTFEGRTPPSIDRDVFYNTNNCPIYVPCGTKEAYLTTLNVNNTIDESRVIEKLPYIYSVLTSDSTLGSVTITQEPTCTEPVIFRADAAAGYQFAQWSDGNTDNPRSLILTQDTTIKAEFELCTYTVTWLNYDSLVLELDTNVAYGTIPSYDSAVPAKPSTAQYTYTFAGWSPEVVATTEDATYIATYTSALRTYSVLVYGMNDNIILNGTYPYGESVLVEAIPEQNYQFTQWSDGNSDNPRSLILTQDTILKALFEQIIIEQDTIIVTDSTDISDIITGGQDTIPYVEVQPGGEITIDRDDIGIGVITIITIGTESGQVHPWDGGYDNLKNTRVVMEYVLNPFGQTASPDKWYAFAVPFKVDIETGITRKYGNKSHVPGKDFMILEYDSELRSRTGSGWKEKKSGLLEPGHFYMLGIEGNCNRWLFEKVRDADVVGDKEKDLQHYAHGNSKNNGWHGLGNTTLEYVDMSFDGLNATYVYTYDNQYGRYNIYSIEELILAVGQPFFTQGDNDGSVAFTPNNGKGKGNGKKNMPIYAPSYDVQPSHPRVLLTIETEKINATPDRLYITLHDDNQCGSYRIGRDFMRMDKGSKQVPNFWCPMADGTQLSAHGVTMPTTYTTIPLGIFTPAKGEYTINAHMQDMDDYIVELYYQNVCLGIVMQGVPFRLEMAAGTSYEYSIRISRRVSTDLNPAEDTQCDKDNKWYDVLGRPLPQDAHGIFIRKGEKIIK